VQPEDRSAIEAALPHRPFARATVEGRADDVFHYGELAIDPLVIRTVMVRTPPALEYQVRPTDRWIDIAIIAQGELDHATLALLARAEPPQRRPARPADVPVFVSEGLLRGRGTAGHPDAADGTEQLHVLPKSHVSKAYVA
jgi:hypothetical protein